MYQKCNSEGQTQSQHSSRDTDQFDADCLLVKCKESMYTDN